MPEDMTPMDQDQLRQLLEGGGGGAKPPYNPQKHGETAREGTLMYLTRADERLKAGQIIRQRIGLCLQQRQFANIAYAFVKYLEGDDVTVVKFPEYHVLDCVIAQADMEGDIHMFLSDSRRYEPYPQDDLERLGAEASKAIN